MEVVVLLQYLVKINCNDWGYYNEGGAMEVPMVTISNTETTTKVIQIRLRKDKTINAIRFIA